MCVCVVGGGRWRVRGGGMGDRRLVKLVKHANFDIESIRIFLYVTTWGKGAEVLFQSRPLTQPPETVFFIVRQQDRVIRCYMYTQ